MVEIWCLQTDSVRCMCVLLFFFKQKTAYEIRISDWSSDVCSSDLKPCRHALRAGQSAVRWRQQLRHRLGARRIRLQGVLARTRGRAHTLQQDRKSVV